MTNQDPYVWIDPFESVDEEFTNKQLRTYAERWRDKYYAEYNSNARSVGAVFLGVSPLWLALGMILGWLIGRA